MKKQIYRRLLTLSLYAVSTLALAIGLSEANSYAYDLSTDFSLTSNPNGPWSYGTLTNLSGPFILYTNRQTSFSDNSVRLDYWLLNLSAQPYLMFNGTTNTGTANGGQSVFLPGSVEAYPAVSGGVVWYGAVRFTVPAGQSAVYTLQTTATNSTMGSMSGDTEFHVLKNGTQLYGLYLASSSGTGYSNVLSLAEGDTVDFAVGPGQDGDPSHSGAFLTANLIKQTPNCSAAPAGLAAWWRAEDDPGDALGTNSATLAGGATYDAGEVGHAFLFATNTAAISVPASPTLNVGTNGGFTVEAWIMPTALSDANQWLWGWEIVPSSYGSMLKVSQGGPIGCLMANLVDIQGGNHIFYTDAVLQSNVFQHIALTYDGSSGLATIYHNGTNVAEQNFGTFTPQTSYPFVMGAAAPGEHGFSGLMDEVSLYNRALTSNEVRAVYASASYGKCYNIGYPVLFSQPNNQTATVGGSAAFGVVAVGVPTLAYQWYQNDTNLVVGATNASLSLTNLQLTQAGYYRVMVTNPLGSVLSSNALLTVTADAPAITNQPASKSILLSSNATFSVAATGSLPLSYQWFFNSTNLLSGETGTTLTLTNVSLARAGYYRAVVSNAFGTAISSNALLTVTFPPVPVQLKSASFTGSSFITVPITWAPNGNENALSLSVSFDATRLTYSGVSLGAGSAGAELMLNVSQVSTGRLGMWIALPPGSTFSAGTQQLAQVTFWVGPLSGTILSSVNFVDVPWTRQLWDNQLGSLSATYAGANLTLSPASNYEGDVYPRLGGDKSLAPIDWLMVGRYAARLDYPTNASEYQRADCAPRATLGNGVISVADWVQAGRYIFGWDPLTALGGPTNNLSVTGPGASATRVVSVGQAGVLPGHSVTVPITLAAQGNENALGFTVGFNPSLVQFTGASLGSGAASADLLVNTNQAGVGQLGIALALPTGSTFPAGTNEVVQVTFQALAGMSGSFTPTLSDQVVVREVADAAANALPVSYANGSVTVYGAPVLSVANVAEGVELRWPAWAADFTLQASGTNWPSSGDWTSLAFTPMVTNNQSVLVLPLAQTSTFYRLFHP